MRIERTTDIQEIKKCLPMEQEIRRKGRDDTRESELILFVESFLNNPFFGFWIAYDDNEDIFGYMILMANPSQIKRVNRLHLVRINAKTKELREAFEEVKTEFAKQFNIKTMNMTIDRHIKTFQRMGWKVVSVNLERRI